MSTARPTPHRLDLESEAVAKACSVEFGRRSGPGGQNRNKVETAVVLIHGPTGLRAEANERRSQAENRRAALFRLRLLLALSTRIPPPPDSAASALWRHRFASGKLAINPEHDDFPILLAEALDTIDAMGGGHDVSAAARALGTTTSQLVGLLQKAPRALAQINQQRRAAGLPPLR